MHTRPSIRYRVLLSQVKKQWGLFLCQCANGSCSHFGVGHPGSLSVAGARGCGLAELGWHHSSYFPGLGTGNCWA